MTDARASLEDIFIELTSAGAEDGAAGEGPCPPAGEEQEKEVDEP